MFGWKYPNLSLPYLLTANDSTFRLDRSVLNFPAAPLVINDLTILEFGSVSTEKKWERKLNRRCSNGHFVFITNTNTWYYGGFSYSVVRLISLMQRDISIVITITVLVQHICYGKGLFCLLCSFDKITCLKYCSWLPDI